MVISQVHDLTLAVDLCLKHDLDTARAIPETNSALLM